MNDEQRGEVPTNEEIVALYTARDRQTFLELCSKNELFRQLTEAAQGFSLPEHPSSSGVHQGLKPIIHTGNWFDFTQKNAKFSAGCPQGEECGKGGPYSFMYLPGGHWVINQ